MNKPSNSKKTNINQEIDELKSNHSETRPANNSWELELQTIDHTEAQHFRGGPRGVGGRISGSVTNAQAITLPTDYSQLSNIVEQ